jgi:hypothetical protein
MTLQLLYSNFLVPSENREREERQDRTTCSNQKRAHLREINKVNEDLSHFRPLRHNKGHKIGLNRKHTLFSFFINTYAFLHRRVELIKSADGYEQRVFTVMYAL